MQTIKDKGWRPWLQASPTVNSEDDDRGGTEDSDHNFLMVSRCR